MSRRRDVLCSPEESPGPFNPDELERIEDPVKSALCQVEIFHLALQILLRGAPNGQCAQVSREEPFQQTHVGEVPDVKEGQTKDGPLTLQAGTVAVRLAESPARIGLRKMEHPVSLAPHAALG